MKPRAWLQGGVLLLLCVLLGATLHIRSAVVTVRFEPRGSSTTLDYLFVTVGADKQSAEALRPGAVERFVFSPGSPEPLVMGFWMGTRNGGWEGPVLRPRQRLHISLDGDGHVSSRECDWPCW